MPEAATPVARLPSTMWGIMIRWNYDRHEILADGIVHALGVVGGLTAVIVLLALAAPTVGPWN
jgi:hypothetical protein